MIEFVLIFVFFGMVISIWKGNKMVFLEWEDGILFGCENLVLLFLYYIFFWVDLIVWDGWKELLEFK